MTEKREGEPQLTGEGTVVNAGWCIRSTLQGSRWVVRKMRQNPGGMARQRFDVLRDALHHPQQPLHPRLYLCMAACTRKVVGGVRVYLSCFYCKDCVINNTRI